ncbi:hypothetical protein J1614_004705 [Plenodomus biglobosus]|nr:hypothetical protein J1614_004705 [Plenodomus biglobosus]
MPPVLAQSPLKSKTPLLIFVLGPPCAGKSTLCKAISTRYNLDHFSIGDEMRSLVSPTPTGHAAHIKPKFSASELDIFTRCVRAGTLGPVHHTPKYVKERIFPESTDPKDVKILIDGFPRQVERWEAFKDSVKDVWDPETGIALVLAVDRRVARERFVARGRDGDIFEKRFYDHEGTVEDIVKAMCNDGMGVFELCSSECGGTEAMLDWLETKKGWFDAVGEPVSRGV